MTKEEMEKLVKRYFRYRFPTDFEHRYEPHSSAQCYALIRKFKPTSVLEFGTSRGGATCFIQHALMKNKKPFVFVASEKEKELRKAAKRNVLKRCGKAPKFIGAIEENLDKVPKSLDFVFIDTDHDIENTKWYLKHIIPRIKKGGLVAIHDWAVAEVDGKLVGKGHQGEGGWDETNYLMELYQNKRLPLEKLYWNYEEGERREGSFWIKK